MNFNTTLILFHTIAHYFPDIYNYKVPAMIFFSILPPGFSKLLPDDFFYISDFTFFAIFLMGLPMVYVVFKINDIDF